MILRFTVNLEGMNHKIKLSHNKYKYKKINKIYNQLFKYINKHQMIKE